MILVDGKFYSDKQPLFAFLSAPVYFLLYSFGITFDAYPGLSTYLLKVLIAGTGTAYILVVFYKEIQIVADKKFALLFTIALGFCTLLLSYATALNNHSITALFLFLAFVLFLRYQRTGTTNFFLLGFFLGLVAGLDLVAGFFFFVSLFFFFFFFKKISFQETKLFLFGAAIPFCVHLFLNALILGNPFLPAYAHPDYFAYEGSWQNETNLPGFYNHASLKALLLYSFNNLFGSRGLFSYTPALFFGFFFLLYCFFKKKDYSLLPILFAIIGILSYYCLYTVNYGGASYGSRYFLALTPILFYYSVLFYCEFPQWKQVFFAALLFSFFVAVVGAFNPWTNTAEGIYAVPFITNLDYHYIYNTAAHYVIHFVF